MKAMLILEFAVYVFKSYQVVLALSLIVVLKRF